MKCLFSFFMCLTLFSLDAEISKVSVKWLNPTICAETCINDMAKQLGNMNGAAEIILDQGGGQADIRWKPKSPFSFAPINTAMRLVGPSINNVHISVRGVISHSGSTFTLESLGDNTRFLLIGPTTPSMHQYTVMHNTDNRPISNEMKARLLEAEKNFEIVEIDGPLLDPWRYPALYLIIEQARPISLGPQKEP